MKSLGFALNGLKAAARSEQNLRFHLVAAVLVLAGAAWFRLPAAEWALLMLCIGVVMAGELFNTAIEKLCDVVSPQYQERIKTIKDLAAAAVLLASIAAVGVGLFIFLPRIFGS